MRCILYHATSYIRDAYNDVVWCHMMWRKRHIYPERYVALWSRMKLYEAVCSYMIRRSAITSEDVLLCCHQFFTKLSQHPAHLGALWCSLVLWPTCMMCECLIEHICEVIGNVYTNPQWLGSKPQTLWMDGCWNGEGWICMIHCVSHPEPVSSNSPKEPFSSSSQVVTTFSS